MSRGRRGGAPPPRLSAHALSPVSLSVRSNSIRTEGLLSLAAALKLNSSLADVNIWGNHLEESVSQVRRRFGPSPAAPVALAPSLLARLQAFRLLISSGRLQPGRTDVAAYESDGRVFLAELSNSLSKYRHRISSSPSAAQQPSGQKEASPPPGGGKL